MGEHHKVKKVLGKGHNPARGMVAAQHILDQVPERHVYITQTLPSGHENVWEADLLGVELAGSSDGSISPQLHIECPYCTSATDRRALSILYADKPFSVEPLKEPITKAIMSTEGPKMIVFRHLLTVKEPITCTHAGCGATFRIVDGKLFPHRSR